jgi:VanZ family protein
MSANALMRVTAWIGVFSLAVASWTPAQHLVRTGLNGRLEHFIAYLLTGTLLLWAYKSRSTFALSLVAYAAVLEAGQMFVQGRHAALLDWAAGATGALCALMLFVAVAGATRSRAVSRD